MLRFHLDESVSSAVAAGLRRRGIDVTTATEAGLRTAPDEAHFEFAIRAGRVLVAHDADFLALAANNVRHTGIAYCHSQSRTVGQIIQALVTMNALLEPTAMTGKVQFI
jgi:predicted nuclease of predicted toxin-antitoxin system